MSCLVLAGSAPSANTFWLNAWKASWTSGASPLRVSESPREGAGYSGSDMMVLLVRHPDRVGGPRTGQSRGHDEVVLVQAFDLLRLQRDGGVAPTKANIRMVALRLGQRADVINEGECLRKVPKRNARSMQTPSS